jgi:predicted Zn-dependent protease
MDWEMDPKAKISGTHGPVIDPLLIRSVSERTIAAYALAANQGPLENSAALKDGEAAIWSRYISWLRSAGKAADAAEAALRATRACPQSPSLWCTLLQEMVSLAKTTTSLTARRDSIAWRTT